SDERLFEVFRAAGAHRLDDCFRLHATGDREDRQGTERGAAQILDGLQRHGAITIEIDDADLGMDLAEGADERSILFAEVLPKRCAEGEAWNGRHNTAEEMDGGVVQMNRQDRYPLVAVRVRVSEHVGAP